MCDDLMMHHVMQVYLLLSFYSNQRNDAAILILLSIGTFLSLLFNTIM